MNARRILIPVSLLAATTLMCIGSGGTAPTSVPSGAPEGSPTVTPPTDETATIAVPPTGEPIGTVTRELDVVEHGGRDGEPEMLQGTNDLFAGDVLRVRDGGEGLLDFGNDMRLRLFNDTQLREIELLSAPDTPLDVQMFLEEGGFTGKLTAVGGRAVFKTPGGAEITVLGTEFCAVHDPASGMTVVCNFNGTVELAWEGGRAGLPAGHYTRIQSGQPPVSAIPLPVSISEFDKLARELRSPVIAVDQFEELAAPDITPSDTPDITPTTAPDVSGPLAPVLLSPVDQSQVPCAPVTLAWEAVTDPSGIGVYLVVVDSIAVSGVRTPYTTYSIEGNITQLTESLPCGSSYAWWAQAQDGAGNPGGRSDQEYFAVVAAAESCNGNGTGSPVADFNGDGYADLAVGVPDEDIGDVADAGAVSILYGSVDGLSGTGDQLWHQDSPGVEGGIEAYDSYGWTLATGDFDADGYTDLAVGVPDEAIGDTVDAGAVNILYGSPRGLSAAGNQIWHQDSPEVGGGAEADDSYGWSLTSGDFDGDGYTDLAVGVPNEDIGDIADAGAVSILYGSAKGLTSVRNELWDQDSPDIEGGVEEFDSYGWALAAGDFDGDGSSDLAVGIPDEDIGNVANAGAVNILYGSEGGLSAAGNQVLHQDSPDIEDGVEGFDSYGWALTVGDFDGDGNSDLGVGIPYEDIGGVPDAGAVNILYGSADALTPARDQFWHQDSPDIEGGAEEQDYFGSALAAGDFDGGGCSDLAIGVPYEDIGDIANAGAVNILYGSADSLSARGQQRWDQDSSDIEDGAEAYDSYGFALTSAVPFEDIVE